MIVLVCGSRDWADRATVFETLDALPREGLVVVEGCARGADSIGGHEWAAERGVPVRHHPARWNLYGRAAGPVRNQEMLEERPDLVVAFHEDLTASRGTADMVGRARRRGVPVRVVSGTPMKGVADR